MKKKERKKEEEKEKKKKSTKGPFEIILYSSKEKRDET